MDRTDLQQTMYNKILGENTKGFVSKFSIDNLEGNNIGQVLTGMEYRADLLAKYYLGDSKYGWAIILANHLENGVQDLWLGRKFLIPNIN